MNAMITCTSVIKKWLAAFVSLLFPRCCVVCGGPLAQGEACICTMCNINLPRTGYHLRKDNPAERLFWGKIPVERASSFFFYRKGSDYRHILHRLKYRGEKETGEAMGRCMASELLSSGFFSGIDVIVPVPLHRKRHRARGYNQSEWIARGVSGVTGLPVETDSVVRCKHTATQVGKSVFARWENVDGIFSVVRPGRFAGKHVLIIDDVLTTGATTAACACSLVEAGNVRVSILTLAVAAE
ncbi:ComF family protein [Bacteroides pyogenes]|uniref:ComF family protein n=1 Tax=Bacteroides pyogenes TaxID=310300 RepID=UPI0003DC64DF|nr:ComF family protein [Bacteroides pyogenes]MBB3894475.1 ComF family protein [Bacteroides pyogenes]GAE21594.1 hypothetical protein JCM10003_1066 [Bacteroides pyogenes JCM 10003]SUV32340.1 Predicted amidophosphoribosyltransferases [Bacteroides pyogenes]